MTKTKDSTFFENKLLDIIAEPDPLYSMMQWLTEQLMEMKCRKKRTHKRVFIAQSEKPIVAAHDYGASIPDWGLCICLFRNYGKVDIYLFS